MKTVNKRSLALRSVTAALLLFACFYMYDFYKCLSGFIANGFREPLVMLPMITSFFLPVLCFLFYFYDFFVRAINPVVKAVYSVVVAIYAAADLALIINNISLYRSNNGLGVYDSLPSIILHFPYDMILVLSALFALQIFNLIAGNRPTTKAGAFWDSVKQRGTLRLRALEYVALSVMAIVVFVFTGSGIYAAFSAFENAFYDARYIYLLIWVAVIPMANLALLTWRPEKLSISKRAKITSLGALIGANLVFGLLLLVLELTYPDFIVHIGKPLFLIAFSVSLPIEPGIILGIMAIGSLIAAIRLVMVAKNAYSR